MISSNFITGGYSFTIITDDYTFRSCSFNTWLNAYVGLYKYRLTN